MSGNNTLEISRKTANLLSCMNRDVTSEREEKAVTSFMDIMKVSNQLPQQSKSYTDTKKSTGISDVNIGKTENQKRFDTYTPGKKNIEVKKDVTAKELQSESGSKLEEFENKIKDTLKEELGLSEEQINAAMEELGMTAMDLTDVKNLTSLVQLLTGTGQDIGTLLMSESFMNVMAEAVQLTEDLCNQLGITMEELTALCKEMTQQNETGAPILGETVDTSNTQGDTPIPPVLEGEEASKALEGQQEDSVDEPEITLNGKVSQGEDVQNEQAAKTVSTAVNQNTEEDQENVKPFVQGEAEVSETEEADILAQKSNTSFSDSGEDSFMNNSNGHSPEHTGNITPQATPGMTQPFVDAMTQSIQAPHSVQMDISDIIEQITRNAKVTVTAANTSMDMQLNPENLGKIYLHISEHEGVIRAEIATQSENVKQALEAQIVELRQSLNQQGVKVDAIEVTVATHEFEQNLDGNASQEEQLQQQMAEQSKKSRRNLNLNDLGQLSGLMSEEETLVTKMMQEQGNQVDLNA